MAILGGADKLIKLGCKIKVAEMYFSSYGLFCTDLAAIMLPGPQGRQRLTDDMM
jgi:hypothetical protein